MEEQLEAIRAIYGPDAVTIHSSSGATVEIRLRSSTSTTDGVCCTLRTDVSASTRVVEVIGPGMSSSLRRTVETDVAAVLQARAADEPWLLEAACAAAAVLDGATATAPAPAATTSVAVDVEQSCTAAAASSQQESKTDWLSVVHLDHMRDAALYCRTLKQWHKDLALQAVLVLHCPIHVLVAVLGRQECVDAFLVNLRTHKVDVDASGRRCKERQQKLMVSQASGASCARIQGFHIDTASTVDAVHTWCAELGLDGPSLYSLR